MTHGRFCARHGSSPWSSRVILHCQSSKAPLLLSLLLLLPFPLQLQAQTAPAAAATATVAAPATERLALSIDEFERWRTVRSVGISDDGRWVSYAYERRRTDDTLYVRELDGDRLIAVPRASRPEFSDDGRWIAYFVSPTAREVEKLERERKPVPLRAELRDLRSGEVVAGWENAQTMRFAKGSRALVVRKVKADPRATHDGADLILRYLDRGQEELIGSVAQFDFNKLGTHLAYTISTASKEGNGLYLLDVATTARRALDGERQEYVRLTWDEDGVAIAVLRGGEKEGFEQKEHALVVFTGISARGEPARFVYDPSARSDFPAETVISERGSLSWSADRSRVFIGLKEQTPKPKRADDAEPQADVDIWHWADERIQSVQMVRAAADRNRTHSAAVDLASGSLIRLGDETLASVQFTRDGRWGIGRDERGFVHDWEPARATYYRIDTRTGERVPFLEAHDRTMNLSPDGRHYLYWKDGHIWTYVLPDNRHINLTASAPVSFANMQWDYFGERPPYGVAGFTSDGRAVILEHRFDLWLQPLDGRAATNLTQGRGERDAIRFRHVQLDPEARTIDLSKPLLLSAFGDQDKRSGYFQLQRGRLEELVYGDAFYGRPQKARNAERMLLTIERFDVFPDLHWTEGRFADLQRLTDANPQQSDYRWGRRILFDYVNSEGVPLQGTLAIPDDYQPGQRLPMLVNFYEKNSQNLHRYPTPRYASSPQFAGFVSNGYLVMQPDVHYSTGPSHSQMLDAVEAAVRKVVELGYADPARVGLHGHSYSGQGSAFIATQSQAFAAIVAGAAATNLVSDFNQLWKSSGTSQHRYDIYGQGRFGTNPFDDPELFRSQSAVHNARSMDTPLMLLHGTDDGSVEWLQAVEFYNALRFNGKEVVLLSYPGEGHGLRRFENQKDFLVRMQQFFDHHLKGEAAPDWYLRGVPFLEKNRQPAVPVVTQDRGW
jgi:dipeptidyl aminopeptidase/acylaminoacyl peptidase